LFWNFIFQEFLVTNITNNLHNYETQLIQNGKIFKTASCAR